MAPRKLMAVHPSRGYAILPQQDPKTAKRNARERNRVKTVNTGFDVLKTHIPSAAGVKKMSKVNILSHAVDYIQYLHRLIHEQQQQQQHSPAPQADYSRPAAQPGYVAQYHPEHHQGAAGYPAAAAAAAHHQHGSSYAAHPPLTPLSPPAAADGRQQQQQFHFASESGYESSYYSDSVQHSPSCTSTPSSAHYLTSTPGRQFHQHQHHQQHQHLDRSPWSGAARGASSAEAPRYSPISPAGRSPAPDSTTVLIDDDDGGETSSEEDDILDAIAEWQEES